MVSRLSVLIHPLFLTLVVGYVIIRLLRLYEVNMPFWVNGYITDFICIPFVLIICLAGVRLIKRSDALLLSVWHIGMITAEFALLFEVILPQRSDIYTADWMDVVMYLLGGIFYWYVQPILQPRINRLS